MSEQSREDDIPETERGEKRPARTPNQVGETGRSDIGAEGLGQEVSQGRGAVAYGGRGDVGMGESTLGGDGRGTEGGAFNGTGGRTGGAGGEGRGTDDISRGGGESSDLRPAVPLSNEEEIVPNRGPMPPPSEAMGDVTMAGGAGEIGAEDRLADSGLRDQGGVGRESQSTEGEESGSNESGPAGDDRPAGDGRAA